MWREEQQSGCHEDDRWSYRGGIERHADSSKNLRYLALVTWGRGGNISIMGPVREVFARLSAASLSVRPLCPGIHVSTISEMWEGMRDASNFSSGLDGFARDVMTDRESDRSSVLQEQAGTVRRARAMARNSLSNTGV